MTDALSPISALALPSGMTHRRVLEVRLEEIGGLLGEHPPYRYRNFPLKPLSLQMYEKVLPTYRSLVADYCKGFSKGRPWMTEQRFRREDLPVAVTRQMTGDEAGQLLAPLSKSPDGEPSWTTMQVAAMVHGYFKHLGDDTLMWYSLVQSSLRLLYKQVEAQEIGMALRAER